MIDSCLSSIALWILLNQFLSILFINWLISLLKLKEDNFLTWKSLILALLTKFRATNYLTGTNVCLPQHIAAAINPAYMLWKDEDSTITLLLYSTMSESVVPYFAGATSAFVLWMNIQNRFSQVSATHTIQLRTKLQSIRLGNGFITTYLSDIKKVVDALAAAGSIVSDSEIVVTTLSGLSSSFDAFAMSIRVRYPLDLN